MKNWISLTLILAIGPAFGEDEICAGVIPLDKVKEICGTEFIKHKVSVRRSRCKASYIEKALGSKYGAVGISSELILSMNHRINKEGKSTAPTSYKSSIDGAKQREVFKEEVADLGEGAHYSELDIHQTVTWYAGEYLYFFTVDKGKLNDEDWVAPCTPEQTIELARIIGNQ